MYLKQIYLSKTTAAGCLFKIFQKKPKKSKNPKAQKQQPYCYTTSFSWTELFIALFKIFIFFVNIYSTMMYNIFNATEVKTNIPCK